MKILKKPYPFALIIAFLLFSYQAAVSQQVVIKNGVEYVTDEEESSENGLSLAEIKKAKLSKKKLLPKKKKIIKKKVDVAKMRSFMSSRNSLRFRKKRDSNKCFKEALKECDSINNKETPKD